MLTSYVAALKKTCLLLLAGGLAAQHSTLLLPSDHCTVLLVASLCLWHSQRGRALAIFLAGFAAFMLAAGGVVAERLDPAFAGDSMLARVRVAGFPKMTDRSLVFRIEPAGDQRIPQNVRVSWFDPPHIPAIGEIWELELRLRRPRGTSNPGVFDFESWLFRERIHATGYVVGGKRNRLLWSGTATAIERFRSEFVRRTVLAADSPEVAAVMVAIGVGQRHLMTHEQWNRFAISGTSHLMAISGLHIGLAALAAFLLAFVTLGVLPGCRNHYVASIAFGALCALAYAVISGSGVPAQRAVLMLAIAGLTIMRRRQVDGVTAVALAAAIVFLADPIATMTPGFHLSFAAVVVLLWLARRRDVVWRAAALPHRARQLLVTQVYLLFGLLPLTALIFQRFAVVATPVNLVAIPLFSIVTVPFTLAGMVVGGLSESLATGLLRIAARSIQILQGFISGMVSLPFADIGTANIDGAAWLIVFLPLMWAVLPRGWPGRGLAVLGIIAIVSWKPAPPPAGCFDAWVLDVGQGLAVVVQTRSDVLLFDTGMAWRGGGSVAAQTIVPFLRSRRIDFINWLVVSHSDLDHSGGLHAIRDAIPVGALYSGEALLTGSDQPCLAGQSWTSGQVEFSVLHPTRGVRRAGNAASCVLRVSIGPHALLLTGDIEARSEHELIQRGGRLASDVAVVPHHGSRTSSTMPFITSVQPDFAVVSAGYANRWGFPKPRVVERWQAAGAEVLNTATSGAVGFRVCAQGGVVRSTRERERRYRFWHAGT